MFNISQWATPSQTPQMKRKMISCKSEPTVAKTINYLLTRHADKNGFVENLMLQTRGGHNNVYLWNIIYLFSCTIAIKISLNTDRIVQYNSFPLKLAREDTKTNKLENFTLELLSWLPHRTA